MLTTFLNAPGHISVEDRPRPILQSDADAVVRVVAACVCGSDLWGYRGISEVTEPQAMGHEAIGVVEEVGDAVSSAKPGDFVIIPFSFNCGDCQACAAGCPASCVKSAWYDSHSAAQAEFVRVPMANASLFVTGLTEGDVEARGLIPHLLALSDVMSTGYHAAKSANVGPGDVVAVVGDGAVGLCAVLSAKLLGAKTVIAMSRHEARSALAREFGADVVVAERGEAAPAAIRAVLDGNLADVALECVGTKESMNQAFACVRGGGRVGYVGVPHGGVELDVWSMFSSNVSLAGGLASARRWMEELLPLVISGEIEPGKVFDLTLPLGDAAAAYAAMDRREAIKVMLRP